MEARDPEKSRKAILESAVREIHVKGYRSASIHDILASTGLSKGALYHHFPNKKAIAFAVLDEIEKAVEQIWLEQLKDCQDPLSTLNGITKEASCSLTDEEVMMGCPLNNLAQEMSAVDEELRERIAFIYGRWKSGIAEALVRGQKEGTVNRHIDPESVASFYVASLAGSRGLAKTARESSVLMQCIDNLSRFMDALRVKKV